MNALFTRYLPATIVALWGAMLAFFYFSGRIASYLHPAFHLWTGVSGIVLFLLAAALLFFPGRNACDHGCEHDHAPQWTFSRSAAAIVLLCPLTASFISPDQFGATAVLNRGYIESIADLPGYQSYADPALPSADGEQSAPEQPVSLESYLTKNENGQFQIQTVDLLYAAEEPSLRADFENQGVEIVGQFMPSRSNNPQGDRFSVVRMFVMCCAADARPVAVTVQAPGKESFPDMSWVKVTGRATFPVEGGRRQAVVLADSVAPCDPPEETFIY